MTTDGISWDDRVPESTGPYIPIYSAKPFGSFELVVLSSAIHGVWTHWWEERTTPCRKATGDCPCLREKVSSRWRGYLGCWEPRFDRVVLVELTAEAVKHCNIPIGLDSLDLRGLIIKVSRLGRTKRGPVRIECKQATAELGQLPAEPDVHAALVRVWEGKDHVPPGPNG